HAPPVHVLLDAPGGVRVVLVARLLVAAAAIGVPETGGAGRSCLAPPGSPGPVEVQMARALMVVLQLAGGLVLAGLVLGLVVPVMGESAGPGVAVAVTIASVAVVLLAGRLLARGARP